MEGAGKNLYDAGVFVGPQKLRQFWGSNDP